MKPSESLFELIKSLNRTEKGYFKKYSRINELNSQSNYLLLFDAIDNQEKYDEKILLKKFEKSKTFVKQFPVTKNYLNEKILIALDSYHHSICSEAQKLLHSAEILFKKAHYDQSLRILHKAKKIVTREELTSYLLEIHHWEYNIAIEKHDMLLADKINREWKQSILLCQNVQTYRDLFTKMLSLFFEYGRTKNKRILNKINALIKNPALKNESAAITFYSKIRFYDTHLFFWCIKGDRDKIHKYAKKIIALFHSDSEKIRINIDIYLDCLDNILSAAITDKRFQETYYYLNTLKEITKIEKSKNINAKFSFIYYRHLLYYYNYNGDFDKSNKEINGVQQALKLYEDELNQLEKFILFMNISITLFGIENYKSCLFWLNRIRNEISIVLRPEILRFFNIFYLITHYEAGNIDILPNLSKSIYRFLSKTKNLSEFDRIMLSFIRNKLPVITTIKQKIKYFKQLEKRISSFTSILHRENAFYLLGWIESKTENKSFAETIKEKSQLFEITS